MIDYKIVKIIDELLKSKQFSGLTELLAFLLIAEDGPLTSKIICKKLNANNAYVRNLLSQMKLKDVITSVDDEQDKSKNILKRQLYSLSSKGINLYRALQDDKALDE